MNVFASVVSTVSKRVQLARIGGTGSAEWIDGAVGMVVGCNYSINRRILE